MTTTVDLPASVDLEAMQDCFRRNGYALARGLFSKSEVDEIRIAFDRIAAGGPIPGFFDQVPADQLDGDPLKQYPRVHHPHRFDDASRRYLIHPGVMTCLRSLMRDEVLAAQSMFYFKPPGARGQAMHQDNFYLMVEPQTCVAAWTAIDESDPDNGGMYLVEETAEEEIACPGKADPTVSFTTHLVPVPKGKKVVPCIMRAGDTLFFNGSMIHGSEPNRSKDRFRRAFICHYVPRSTVRISKYYLPLLAPDGEEVMLEPNASGGACGKNWLDEVVWEGSAH